MEQKGQVILVLLLVMSVGLAIGLSIIQRSLTDISTANKIEFSSRAFSAAEAGIERALNGDSGGVIFEENNSSATILNNSSLPLPKSALEYPPVGKEEIAHFWLANPNDLNKYYDADQLEIYWGSYPRSEDEVSLDKPAIELTLIYESSGAYLNKKYFIDPVSTRNNGFLQPSDSSFQTGSGCSGYLIATSFGENRNFYCKVILRGLKTLGNKLVLIRTRLVYTPVSQPVAVMPVVVEPCSAACSLPPQAKLITSVGRAGEVQRTVQLFQVEKVVPFYFDYAVFAAGEINK